jgi:hypothetical protein
MRLNRIVILIICALFCAGNLGWSANYHFISPPVMQDYQPKAADSIYAIVYNAAGDSIYKLVLTAADTLRTGVYEATWSNANRGPLVLVWHAFVGPKHVASTDKYTRLEDSTVTVPTNFSVFSLNSSGQVSLTTSDWVTDGDITTLKSDLATAHGAGSWLTPVGFSTHSAADVWAVATRTLTTADWTTDGDITTLKSDLATAHGAGSWLTATGFSTHSAADVWAVATRTLTSPTFPTNLSALKISATGYASINANDVDGDFTATDFEAASLNGKGDWNVGKTDYALSAAAIGDELKAGHTINGSFGAMIDDSLSTISVGGAGNWSVAQVDSAMHMLTRIAIADYAICDSTYTKEFPLNYKPKDSVQVYCIYGTDTTLVGTFTATIYGLTRALTGSAQNVLNNTMFKRR